MQPARVQRARIRPPYLSTLRGDLAEVTQLVFVYFLGTVVLWPIIIVISILFIPLTWLVRRLLLVCSIPCTCTRCGLRCKCRVAATALETTWIKSTDKVMTHGEFRARLRAVRTAPKHSTSDENIEAQAQEPLMDAADNSHINPAVPFRSDPTSQVADASLDEADGDVYKDNIHTLVMVVEKSLSLVNLVSKIDQRITSLTTNETDGKYFPRFTQCLVQSVSGHHYWADDPAFSLANHVQIEEEKVVDQKGLQELLNRTAEEGLPVNRPLWHLILASGYGTLSDTVLIWRFHGTMYDAVTIAKIIVYALTNPKFITFKAFNQYYHHHNHVIKNIFTGPVRFLYLLLSKKRRRQELDTNTNKEGSKPQSQSAHYAWTERTLNLSQLLKNKMLLSMSFNDLILSIFTGAARGHDPNTSEQTDDDPNILQNNNSVLIPVDLWTGLKNRKTLPQGNHMIYMPCAVSKVPEVIPRLWRTEHFFSEMKQSGDTRTQLYSLNWLGCLPFSQTLCNKIHNGLQGDSNILFTSFPGPNTLDNIDGATIHDIMYFASPPAHVQYSFSFITYSGTVKLMTQSADKLPENYPDHLVQRMASQLSVINKMIFQRYFPDGLDQSTCPYAQPQANRMYSDFMRRMREIEEIQSCADRLAALLVPAQEGEISSRSRSRSQRSRSVSPTLYPHQLVHDDVDSRPTSKRTSPKLNRSRTPSPQMTRDKLTTSPQIGKTKSLSLASAKTANTTVDDKLKTSVCRKDSPVLLSDANLGLGTPSASLSSENEKTRSPTLDSSLSNQFLDAVGPSKITVPQTATENKTIAITVPNGDSTGMVTPSGGCINSPATSGDIAINHVEINTNTEAELGLVTPSESLELQPEININNHCNEKLLKGNSMVEVHKSHSNLDIEQTGAALLKEQTAVVTSSPVTATNGYMRHDSGSDIELCIPDVDQEDRISQKSPAMILSNGEAQLADSVGNTEEILNGISVDICQTNEDPT